MTAKDVAKYTVVDTTEVIPNGEDYKYTIGPDHDGLGLLEVIYYEQQAKNDQWQEIQRLSMSPQDAFMVGQTLVRHAEMVTEDKRESNS